MYNFLNTVAYPYAFKTRYPDSAFMMPCMSVAQDAVKRARKIYDFVVDITY